MKNLINRTEAEEILRPYHGHIVSAMQHAFLDCLNIVGSFAKEGQKIEFSKATFAGIVHDITKSRIKELFINDTEVSVGEFNRVFGVKISDKLFIRFKKLNDDFTTSNIQTKQTIHYANQLDIEGFPESLTYLYAGYMPDVTWTSIRNIYLLCKQGDSLKWHIDLTGSFEQTELDLFNTSIDQEITIVSRVKLKDKKANISKTGS